MRIPGPLRELYEVRPGKLAIMKGAQVGLSEYAINLSLWCADTGYAGRGTALYVQPTGGSAGDFVQGRVNPAIEASEYLQSRIGTSTKDPDKVGLRRVGVGYTYWRTAKSRSGLKSVPADVLILDEFDEMPADTLALASHRLDSSAAPVTAIISTPTYPGVGIEPEYLGGDQRQYRITCGRCGTEQALDWEKNVDLDLMLRVCVSCRESIEDVIAAAWWNERPGRWVPQRPEAPYRSYHLSQLYRPDTDLAAIQAALRSANLQLQQEAWNQHLGLPFAPPGNQLSVEELRRLQRDYELAAVAGIRGCYLGADIGSRIHVALTVDTDQLGPAGRYLVGVFEVDTFEELDGLMRRFGVVSAVLDAHPELHSTMDFARAWRGRVWLCDYKRDQTPPLVTTDDVDDPKRQYRVQVDRTAAMDALAGFLREERMAFPRDAESVPGFFGHLTAPVRRLEPTPDGNIRGVWSEGARPDHWFHALVYAELAAYIGQALPRRGVYDVRDLSPIGSYEREFGL